MNTRNNYGIMYYRTEKMERERAFAEAWAKRAAEGAADGDLLDQLLIAQRRSTAIDERLIAPSPRERAIVATVIQWLGSPVGWAFLADALKAAGYRLEKNP